MTSKLSIPEKKEVLRRYFGEVSEAELNRFRKADTTGFNSLVEDVLKGEDNGIQTR